VIEVRDLVKVYPGPVPALQGVSLNLPPGMFGLLGPNGSGKTTFMRILAGLLDPTAGKVFWDGEDVTRRPERVWPRLGLLPQDFGFYPDLTGREMLTYLLRLKGVEAPGGLTDLSAELLERVNLTDAADRRTGAYSGGMKRRLGIAQAIAGDPKLLIIDEPTAGLDPEERMRVASLLSELAQHRTVVLSTHIVDDVATLCPRLAFIRSGRLLASTSPGRARAALRGRLLEGSVEAEAGQNLIRTAEESAGRIAVTRTLLREGRSLVRCFVRDGARPDGFEPVEPTLEDAYVLLMRGVVGPASMDEAVA